MNFLHCHHTQIQLDVPRQGYRRLESLATPLASRRLASGAPAHVPPKRKVMGPACISTFATHVLEAEMRLPYVLSDVFDVNAMTSTEVETPAYAWSRTKAAIPSADDAAGALRRGVVMSGGEMFAKDTLVDDDVLKTVVHHAPQSRSWSSYFGVDIESTRRLRDARVNRSVMPTSG
jgi:hypothetical protein